MFQTVVSSPMAGSRRSSRTGITHNAWIRGAAGLCFVFLVITSVQFALPDRRTLGTRVTLLATATKTSTFDGHLVQARAAPVLVSYSYFEKDEVQKANMEFFLAIGMGLSPGFDRPSHTDFVIVISGEACTPCQALLPKLTFEPDFDDPSGEITKVWTGNGITVLQRARNEGMDFAAHNVTIEWMQRRGASTRYRFFIFLNSSVRGPFVPAYMPPEWQWTRAYTDRLTDKIKVVSSSIVCLPEVDAGGYGPKVESWAFATDPIGLGLLSRAGVFSLRTCKLCNDGVVVMGEYGLTKVLFKHGYNIATLMARYPANIDWRDERHWHCNNNVHPSRHGTYDGISMHPFETVFIKASWHVGEPHVAHYTKWALAQARGEADTGGSFDEPMYRYAISPQAQEPRDLEACYKVL